MNIAGATAEMLWPRFARTLHFRITAIFVILVVVVGGAYYAWMRATVYSPYDDEKEQNWYEELAENELQDLAARIAPVLGERAAVERILVDYGRGVAEYEAELIVFDAGGNCLATSAPDSLDRAVARADTALLRDMSDGDWDFQSYPDPVDVDSYANRIFDVHRIVTNATTLAAPAGYLVASFEPATIAVGEIERDERTMRLQALVLLLLYAAASSTIIMLWTTRRIRLLARGVGAVAAGDLSTRVPATSADEIGTLGRQINSLAERIESMVSELTQKESFQRLLVANVSHDLRTPLASLRGYIETLSLAGEDVSKEERSRYLTVITEKLDHLDRLIAHVLVLSRIDSGEEVFRAEDFSFGELAETVLERCRQASAHRGVTLDLELERGLPDAHADPLQIGRVLQNLVENGIKFTPDGGRVTVRARRDADGLRVEVADTGIGIPPEDLAHVCKRFYTVDRSRPGQRDGGGADALIGRGTGLGLAIAARLIEGHGSRLEVDSVEDVGSVFAFHLPAGDPPEHRASVRV
jgi:signal transduction histidine kinase